VAPKFENPFEAKEGESGLGYPVDSAIMEPWLLPEGTMQEPIIRETDPEAVGGIKDSPVISERKNMDYVRTGSVKGAVV
jgi:hypothetical protein